MTDSAALPGGTAAVLQGLMTMLGEVLDRVDGRLAALESAMAALGEGGPDHGQSEPELAERQAELKAELKTELQAELQGELMAQVSRVEEGMQRGLRQALDANQATASAVQSTLERVTELAGAVDSIGHGMASLAETIPAALQSEHAEPAVTAADLERLADELSRLGTTMAELGARTEQAHDQLNQLGSRTEQAQDQMTQLGSALESLATMMSDHIEETSNSLGQKATKAGRRLASDLGRLSRTRRPSERQPGG